MPLEASKATISIKFKPPGLDVTEPSFLNHAESLIERPFLKADPQEGINLLLEKQRNGSLTKFLHRSVTLAINGKPIQKS